MPTERDKTPTMDPAVATSGRYFVTDRIVNSTGETFYRLVEAERVEDPECKGVFVTAGPKSPAGSALMRQLDALYTGKSENRPMRMTRVKTANRELEIVVDIEPEMTRGERMMFDANGTKLGEYTEDVARSCEGCLDAELERAALRHFAEIEAESIVADGKGGNQGLSKKITEEARAIAQEIGSRVGMPMTPDMLNNMFGNVPVGFAGIVLGQQDGVGGRTNRVRYSLSHAFEAQVPEGLARSDPRAFQSAMRNYALQMASVSSFAERCGAYGKIGDRSVSIGELLENVLVHDGNLAGLHPRKTESDFCDVSRSRGFQSAANVLLGIMDCVEAQPAHPGMDEVEARKAMDKDNKQKQFLHTFVSAQVDALQIPPDQWQKRFRTYIHIAHEQTRQNVDAHRKWVRHEQDKTRPPAPKQEKKGPGAVSNMLDGFFTKSLPGFINDVTAGADHASRMFG